MVPPSVDQVKVTALDYLESRRDHFARVSRDIWDFAELGLNEFRSSDLLVNELETNGFTVERGQARMPTAFTGSYSYGSGKPVIGIIAEYDALPGLHPDRLGQPGHGCGHNLFGTGGLAAAIATKEAITKHSIDGTVRFFGTPSEDTHGGKVWMVREGVFGGIDAVFNWHPQDRNGTPYGSCLAVQILDVEFFGITSHAGISPEKGRSALDGLQIFTTACEFLREHMKEQMRIQYIITAGGEAPNVVPGYARCRMALRGPSMYDIEELRSRDGGIDDCAQAGALGSGTRSQITVVGAFWEDVSNKAGAHLVHKNMNAIGTPNFTDEEKAFAKSKGYDELDETIHEPHDTLGRYSHDGGDVSWIIPQIVLHATCVPKNTPGHHVDMAAFCGMSIGQRGMIFAAKVQVASTIDLMMDAKKLGAVRDEWKGRLEGLKPYHSVIPTDSWPPIPEENPIDFQGPLPT